MKISIPLKTWIENVIIRKTPFPLDVFLLRYLQQLKSTYRESHFIQTGRDNNVKVSVYLLEKRKYLKKHLQGSSSVRLRKKERENINLIVKKVLKVVTTILISSAICFSLIFPKRTSLGAFKRKVNISFRKTFFSCQYSTGSDTFFLIFLKITIIDVALLLFHTLFASHLGRKRKSLDYQFN